MMTGGVVVVAVGDRDFNPHMWFTKGETTITATIISIIVNMTVIILIIGDLSMMSDD